MNKIDFEYQKIMSFKVYSGFLESLKFDYNSKLIINTINPHSYIASKKDIIFHNALLNSDIILPDGIGIILAAKLLNKKIEKRITGADLQDHLLFCLNEKSGSVFYMGSSEQTLGLIKNKILKEYPNLSFGSCSPPFKKSFSESENDLIIKEINLFKPDILFIGMTAPKQEKWLFQNKNKLNFKIACSIGAAFDFYAGTVQRPKSFWINIQLEWLIRFLKEPRRLFRRNFISTPLFLFDLCLYKLKIKR
jgi:N-acetylglucosaminyldiphosphoundecaprenol N-acetyl-beta-D-mannosaminyltransferase